MKELNIKVETGISVLALVVSTLTAFYTVRASYAIGDYEKLDEACDRYEVLMLVSEANGWTSGLDGMTSLSVTVEGNAAPLPTHFEVGFGNLEEFRAAVIELAVQASSDRRADLVQIYQLAASTDQKRLGITDTDRDAFIAALERVSDACLAAKSNRLLELP